MLVFVRTRTETTALAEKLEARGYDAAPLNGDMQQAERERTVDRLRQGRLDILVATDVAARGLDVPRISHIVNYDIPTDTEAYVHRIGRTARAGAKGDAISFVCETYAFCLPDIERFIGAKIPVEPVTAAMLAAGRGPAHIGQLPAPLAEVREGAYGCVQDWIPDAWGMRCTNSADCKVTDCSSTPAGYGCYLVADGRWDVGACSAYPTCSRVQAVINETCCVTAAATPCPKSPPKITTTALQPTPEFPLVIGQDPERRSITLTGITATGGRHDCRTGTISALSVSIRLSSASESWITGELARKYPGAHVLGTYPITPVLITTGLNTATATTSFRFEALDPGDYEITVTATQDDGQKGTKVFTVHVALYESTITH